MWPIVHRGLHLNILMTLLFFSSSSQVYHLGAMGNNFTLGEGFSMIPTYSLPSSMSNTMVILTTTEHFCISVFLINCPWFNNGICSPIKYVVYILYIIDSKEDMSGNGMARRKKMLFLTTGPACNCISICWVPPVCKVQYKIFLTCLLWMVCQLEGKWDVPLWNSPSGSSLHVFVSFYRVFSQGGASTRQW